MVASVTIGAEHVSAPGAEIVLEVVRMAFNEQYPSLMSTPYPGVMATEPRPFGTVDAMWLAFSLLKIIRHAFRYCGRHVVGLQSLANNKTPVIKGVFFFFACFFVGRVVIRLVGGPARQ